MAFKGIFRDFSTAHAQKRIEYYFRFTNEIQIRIPRTKKCIHAEN